MNIDDAVAKACEEPTLVKALSWIAVWETERVVKQAIQWKATGVSTASHGGGWDTCFETCFDRVFEVWNKKHEVKDVLSDIVFPAIVRKIKDGLSLATSEEDLRVAISKGTWELAMKWAEEQQRVK